MTRRRAEGGTVDDAFVEDVDSVLAHCDELIARFHDPEPFALTRVALAPIGINADVPEMFEAFAALADDHPGVRLHTHLYQRIDVAMTQELYGTTPWGFLERHGWATDRVWLAHVIDPPTREILAFAAAGIGVVHIPASDLRMGRGLASIRPFLDSGVTVGFATSGPASNPSSNMLGDLRVAVLAHRIETDPAAWPTARELIHMATRGSADCLGRPDLGRLQAGCAADVACFDLTTVDRIGVHDPVAGLLMTGLSDSADLVIVDGDVLVEDGRPTGVDVDQVAAAARAAVPYDI
jgi:8-oxoguanine deaminase